MTLTIYTTPDCRTCGMAKRRLADAGVPFASVDVTEDEEAAARLKRIGHAQAPVFGWHGRLWTIEVLRDIIREHQEKSGIVRLKEPANDY